MARVSAKGDAFEKPCCVFVLRPLWGADRFGPTGEKADPPQAGCRGPPRTESGESESLVSSATKSRPRRSSSR